MNKHQDIGTLVKNHMKAICAVLVLMWSAGGCAPVQQASPPPLTFPPPVQPPSSSDLGVSAEESPRRMASLHLTEKGKEDLGRGEVKKAMDQFEKAIGIDSNNSAAYYYFAEARFRQKEYQQALSLLQRAEQLMTQDRNWLIKVYLLQGKNLEGLGNRIDASKKYRKVLDLDPGQPEALRYFQP